MNTRGSHLRLYLFSSSIPFAIPPPRLICNDRLLPSAISCLLFLDFVLCNHRLFFSICAESRNWQPHRWSSAHLGVYWFTRLYLCVFILFLSSISVAVFFSSLFLGCQALLLFYVLLENAWFRGRLGLFRCAPLYLVATVYRLVGLSVRLVTWRVFLSQFCCIGPPINHTL